MGAIEGYSKDGVSRGVHLDDKVAGLVTISVPHYAIHDGKSFMITRAVTLPAGNDDEIRLATPNSTDEAHFSFTVISTAEVTVDIFEATSLAHESENALTPVNRDRNSSKTSGCTVCHTPSGTGDGSKIWTGKAGASGFLTSNPGQVGSRAEIILKKNTAYLIRVTGAQNDTVNIQLDWYEYTPEY